jgi:hypothetical protein
MKNVKLILAAILVSCYPLPEPIHNINVIELGVCDKCTIHLDNHIFEVYNQHFEADITDVTMVKIWAYGNCYPAIKIKNGNLNERIDLTKKSIVEIDLRYGIEVRVR